MATSPAPATHTERFRAMGTDAEIQIIGGHPALVVEALERLATLESRWSRFRPDSDISALNAHSGEMVAISPDTIGLLTRAVAGARRTEGRFDPTSGGALIAYGYDRTFAEVAGHADGVEPEPVIDGSWPLIEIDHGAGCARLPTGTVFDPGGIGKGLAADLTVELLRDRCDGVLINIGGDLRVEGSAPTPSGWVVSVDDPVDDDRELGRLSIERGAVASSSRAKRRWRTAGGTAAHHLIDPRTGRPANTGVLAVTVVAGEAWWAEVQATSLFLAGPDALEDLDRSVEAVLVLSDGTVRSSAAFAEVLR